MAILRRFPWYVTAIVLLFTIVSAAQAKYSGGSGVPNYPYQIATAEDLMLLGESPEDYDKHFILTADIDLDPNLPDGRVFDKAVIAPDTNLNDYPYEFQGIPFTGVFDGNGHMISHLEIKGGRYLGLFGQIESRAEVNDIGMVDVNIAGSGNYIGGLVGSNGRVGNSDGRVTRCHSTGWISGDIFVGGLVGKNYGVVSECLSSAAVKGDVEIGGLVALNWGTVTHSHTSGVVDGITTVGGLVGRNEGTISHCSSVGSVMGDSNIGGLVGANGFVFFGYVYAGEIYHCRSTASVRGTGGNCGGLVGINVGYCAEDEQCERSTMSNCYAAGTVDGNDRVGGLVGENHGGVNQCYSAGVVNGTGLGVGGLAGSNSAEWWDDGIASACFWNIHTSGQTTSAAGTGKTTAEMQTAKTFIEAGWDFVGETENGTEDIWKIAEGLGYPRLAWEKYSGGTGEPNDPYQIATAADLIVLGETPADYDKHFILTADMDLDPNLPGRNVFNRAVIAPDVNDSEDWFQGTSFTGVFDGNGHTISHLTINGQDCLGLFGRLEFGAEVKDLAVVDVNITSLGGYIGGLVGYSDGGTVIQCYSTGTVSGNDNVGGLVGVNAGRIISSYNSGAVSGNHSIGGLVGWNWIGGIAMSYSTGSVSGASGVGGLLGTNANWVVQCFSTARVSGSPSVLVGGLIGSNHNFYQTRVVDCFWDTQTSGQSTSDGGTGKTTAEMQTAKTFLDAGWDFVGETTNGTEDIWWILEGQDYPRLWWELIPEN